MSIKIERVRRASQGTIKISAIRSLADICFLHVSYGILKRVLSKQFVS